MADIAGFGRLDMPDWFHRDGDAAARPVAVVALRRRPRHLTADVAGFAGRYGVRTGQREPRAQMVEIAFARLLGGGRNRLRQGCDRHDTDKHGPYETSYARHVHGDSPLSGTGARRFRA